jgi:GGDEF domain-containing protein
VSDIPLVFLVSGIALFAGIHNLVFAYNIPEKREHLYLGLIGILVFAYDIFSGLLYTSESFEASAWYQRGQFSMISAIAAMATLFIARRFENHTPKIYRGLFGFWILFSVVVWIDSPLLLTASITAPKDIEFFGATFRYLEVQPGLLLTVLYSSILVMIVHFMFMLWKVSRLEKKPVSRAIILGLAICLASAVNDILVGIGIFHSLYLSEYAYILIVLMTDQTLTTEFQMLYRQSEHLNSVLEQKVRARMGEIHHLALELQTKNKELEEINQKLLVLTEKDSLTNLYHHKAFQHRLEQSVNLARREKLSIGVGMIDIDHFKSFNDKHGHRVGDSVLKAVANILTRDIASIEKEPGIDTSLIHRKAELRNYDVVSRYGGDEFAIILYFCNQSSADVVLNRICTAVRSLRIEGEPDLRVTLSIGFILAANLPIGATAGQVLEKADQALYEAKALGRDRYVVNRFDA